MLYKSLKEIFIKNKTVNEYDYEDFRVFTEQFFLPILVIQEGDVMYSNEAFYIMAGISCTDYNSKRTATLKSLLYSIPYEGLRRALSNYNVTPNAGHNYSGPIMISTGKDIKWIELYTTCINKNDKKIYFITFLDITEKMNIEKQVRYLAYHDKLTGLYNRSFFEEEVSRLDVSRNIPISIILADLNGLKLTNDVFGHLTGDKLLIKFSKVLKDVCRKEDIIARWGGDEFTILLPKTDNARAKQICEQIKDESNNENKSPSSLSISIGYSTKISENESINNTFKTAENMMYHNKMTESRKTRKIIFESLKSTLFKRTNETEAHVSRLLTLTKDFATFLRLDKKEHDELQLLSHYHDIGMIAINSDIIKKKTSLNSYEWTEMMTHSEKGYKITVNCPESVHISDGILCHHERWDGTGYPQGLKEDDIPLMSRILNIVDSYDIMTHNAVYKKAITHTEAMKEIISCSGKQFDPSYAQKFIHFIDNYKSNYI